MSSKFLFRGAFIGLALTAILLTGSLRVVENSPNAKLPPDLTSLHDRGKKLVVAGRYLDARVLYLQVSERARELGFLGPAAKNLTDAGSCLFILLNFAGAQKDLEHAQDMARSSGQSAALLAAQNNLASLYLHMGEPEKALHLAVEALSSRAPLGRGDHGKLLSQQAKALAEMKRFSEAEPVYRQSIEELTDADDLTPAAQILGDLGAEYLKAGRLDDAESALSEGLWLVRIHRLNASANILSSLAELKSRQGDIRSATALFQAAIDAPPNTSPVWQIRSRRGRFRLDNGDLAGAMEDFREARRIALEMRADMVPADQDRVALETGLSSVMEGLIDAGNRLESQTGDRHILQETFDAAEQDRMWSLRALVPSANDWRSRLPEHYWELLAQYQSLERTAVEARSPESARRIEALRLELQHIEVDSAGKPEAAGAHEESALAHSQAVLNEDSVLLSFLITDNSAWVWAVDHGNVAVYPLASPAKIQADAAAFKKAIRAGDSRSPAGREMYRDLFGGIPAVWLRHSRWLIEPDGTLNDLPFAALEPEAGAYLVERAAIESIPGALLLERGTIPAGGKFLGIGDPIYNSADPRYRAGGYGARAGKPDLTLPRLPNTAAELEACSRSWGSKAPLLLSGRDATEGAVEAALSGNPAIVHFATHVITAPGDFRSGMIALSLDTSGAMGLLGPKDIVARPVSSSLIVMNGCHSAQGETLPSAGLMGLTRAWIGAGAQAVIATGWDVPDGAAQSLMSDFYSALRAAPERGASFALRDAQLKAIQRGGGSATEWAAYSLLSRLQ